MEREDQIAIQELEAKVQPELEESDSDGLAWTLLIVTIAIMILLKITIIALCCYISSMRKQRKQAREIEARSAAHAAESSDFDDAAKQGRQTP